MGRLAGCRRDGLSDGRRLSGSVAARGVLDVVVLGVGSVVGLRAAVADELGLSLAECYRGMYADLEANKRLVHIGTRTAESYAGHTF